MKILFLDDDKYRHSRIQPSLLNFDAAWTASEAIEFLGKNTYDLIFLDHDLGGEIMVSSEREDTGMHVVRYIVDNNIKAHTIIVHSLNPAGAKNMVSLLEQAGLNAVHVPFTVLPQRVEEIKESVASSLEQPQP